eukprot:TRINITY_DN6498_c0_g1_i1.p1 TRINITY_DN6498_c0_g1~~TRINITY_DN6498_c0_g1_i1.p1  ORF type:complete len:2003 (-),score=454.86 TRINITY_DN6498_c0_g1_i1:93-6056(-)
MEEEKKEFPIVTHEDVQVDSGILVRVPLSTVDPEHDGTYHIKMSKMGISHINEDAFKDFADLKVVIDLSHNLLDVVPVAALVSLRKTLIGLNLDYNHITLVEDRTFAEFEHLEELSFAHESKRRLNLHERSFDGLKNLKTLNLSGNSTCKLLESHVDSLQSLEHLLMNECALDIKRIVTKEVVNFSKFPKLKSLHIAKNHLVCFTSEMFAGLEHLEVLDVSDNAISSIPSGPLDSLRSLRELRLQGNPISAFEQSLFVPLQNLRTLVLSNTEIRDLTSEFFKAVSKVETLELNGCDVHLRPRMFSQLKQLKKLHLSTCHLKEIPANSFQGLENLEELELKDNGLTLIHSEGFKGLDSLSKLILSNNHIRFFREGTLCNLRQLLILDLSHNDLRTLSFTRKRNLTLIVKENENLILHEGDVSGIKKLDGYVKKNTQTIQSALLTTLGELQNSARPDEMRHDIDVICSSFQVFKNAFQETYGDFPIFQFFLTSGKDYLKNLVSGSCSHHSKQKGSCDKCHDELSKLEVGLWNVEMFLQGGVFELLQDAQTISVDPEFLCNALDSFPALNDLELDEFDCKSALKRLRIALCEKNELQFIVLKLLFILLDQKTERSFLNFFIKCGSETFGYIVDAVQHAVAGSRDCPPSAVSMGFVKSVTSHIHSLYHNPCLDQQIVCSQCRNRFYHSTVYVCAECNFILCANCAEDVSIDHANSFSVAAPHLTPEELRVIVGGFEKLLPQALQVLSSADKELSEILTCLASGFSACIDPQIGLAEVKKALLEKKLTIRAPAVVDFAVSAVQASSSPLLLCIQYYQLCSEAAETLLEESFCEEANRLLDTAAQIVSDVGSNELGLLLLYSEVDVDGEKVSAASLIFDGEVKEIFSQARFSNLFEFLIRTRNLASASSVNEHVTITGFMETVLASLDFRRLKCQEQFSSPAVSYSTRFVGSTACLILLFHYATSLWAEAHVSVGDPISFYEWFLYIFVGGSLIFDEGEQFLSLGIHYFASLWNSFDFLSIVLFIVLYICRFTGLLIDDPTGTQVVYDISLASLCVVYSFRWLSCLRLEKNLGPLMMIIFSMFNDVFKWVVLSSVILFGFAVSFTVFLSPYGIDSFDSLPKSLFTTANAVMGSSPDLDIFDDLVDLPFGVFKLAHALRMSFVLISVIVLVNFLIAMMSGTFGDIQNSTSVEFRFLKSQAVHESFTSHVSLPPPFTVIVEFLFFIYRLIKLPQEISNRYSEGNVEQNTETWWICAKCHNLVENQEPVGLRRVVDKFLDTESKMQQLQILSLFDESEVCPVCIAPKDAVAMPAAIREVLSRFTWIVFMSCVVFPCSLLIELYGKYQRFRAKDQASQESEVKTFGARTDWASKVFAQHIGSQGASHSVHDRYLNMDKSHHVYSVEMEESKNGVGEVKMDPDDGALVIQGSVEQQLISLLDKVKRHQASDYDMLFELMLDHKRGLQDMDKFYVGSGLKRFAFRQSWIKGRVEDENADLNSIRAQVASATGTLQTTVDRCNEELLKLGERFTEMTKILNTILHIGSTSVPPLPTSRIQVLGASVELANGTYVRSGYYLNRPTWVNPQEFYLWYEGEFECWIIGKDGEFDYAVKNTDVLPPRQGWTTAAHLGIKSANHHVGEPSPNLVFMADVDGLNPTNFDEEDMSAIKHHHVERIPAEPSKDRQIWIDACGVSDVHGRYDPVAQDDQDCRWRNMNDIYIWFEQGLWKIGTIGASAKVLYANSSHQQLPPRLGWILAKEFHLPEASDSASDPCPMLNYVIVKTDEVEDDEEKIEVSPLLKVSKAGSHCVHGIYTRSGDWDGKPMWVNHDSGFTIWFNEGSRFWVLGRTNNIFYCSDNANHHVDNLPPTSHSHWVVTNKYIHDNWVSEEAVDPTPEVATVQSIVVTVSGAGNHSLNGQYHHHDLSGGKPSWKHHDGMLLWWDSEDKVWILGKPEEYYYVAQSSDCCPPATGWIVATGNVSSEERAHPGGVEPCPKLSFS